MENAKLVRAAPRTAGHYFLGGGCPGDRHCPAACYRAHDWGITLLCDHGCSAGGWMFRKDSMFGGSAFAASLNDLPAFAPFVCVRS